MTKKPKRLFDPDIVVPALWDSFKKLDPRHQVKNPVMFVVEVGSVLTTGLWLQALGGNGEAAPGFILAVSALALVHRSLSQTSPKPWPRAAEKRKLQTCAKLEGKRRRRNFQRAYGTERRRLCQSSFASQRRHGSRRSW